MADNGLSGTTPGSGVMRHAAAADGGQSVACALVLTGHVQGVGFRPFVYRLAHESALSGWVQNQMGQVGVHVEGPAEAVNRFTRDLIDRAPPLSTPVIASLEKIETQGLMHFAIRSSSDQSTARVFVPPDYFTCQDCLDELNDGS